MLVLNLLGIPEIQLHDQSVSLGTAKARALLFYLAVTGRPHSREQLLDLLWSDLPQVKARRNLTATLSSLRKEIEEYLLVEGEMIRFNTALPHFIDTAALTAALHTLDETGENGQLPQTVALYRDNFLAGLAVKNAFVFEEWLLTESSRIREQMVRALTYLLDTAVARRETAAALDYATKLLQIEPWLEQAHRQLMWLYARSGRIDAALAQYEKCQQILADELGIEPATATAALYERLLMAREEVAAPLPEDGTPFIGREEELALILERVTQPTCRLFTIVGLGGMGKTRLAIAAAHQLMQGAERPFLNGAVFVSLVGTVGGEGLLGAILTALHEPPIQGRLIKQVIETLKQRELLLILDNFEELLAEINLIQQIIAACPDVTLLVTSREALGISAEHRLDLDGMAVPPQTITTAPAAAGYEAIALFVNIAQQVQPQFVLDETTIPHILTICRLVDGMPLALKLAASWLRALPLPDIVAQLQTNLDILATRLRDIPIRQRSMRAIFDQTMTMLIEEEEATLYGLAVFRGGFTTTAAQTVTHASPFILSELVDRGLIQLGGNGRYQMHELLRQYAAARADAAVQLAHATYYTAWLAQLREHLRDERLGEALQKIAIEVGNVTAAWRYALAEKRFDLLVQSAEALCRFARLRGRYPEGIADLEPAVAAARAAGETAVEAELTDWLGTLYFFSGAHPQAMTAFETALALAEQVAHTHTLANATFHLAQSFMFRDDLERARQLV
ncbi:MAG: hypothetical protein KDE51_09460, partial [Anaerolineales bacterium]|nr:hypothetical protein [Anaerolineales bacterium]